MRSAVSAAVKSSYKAMALSLFAAYEIKSWPSVRQSTVLCYFGISY